MARRNLPDFGTFLRTKALYLTKNSDELVRRVTKKLVEELVGATPVDTGRAATNWRTLRYQPANVLFDKPDEPPDPDWAIQRALDECYETVSYYVGRDSIYITNNTPYLGELNNGSSSQAARNFIETAVQAAMAEVGRANLLKDIPVKRVDSTRVGPATVEKIQIGHGSNPFEDVPF